MHIRLSRLVLLVGVTSAAGSAAWRLTAGPTLELARALRRPTAVMDDWTLDRLVVDLGSALLLVASAGLALMVGLAVTATVAVDRAPLLAARCRRLSPTGSRRLVAVFLGLGLASPMAADGWAAADEHRPECRVVCRAEPPSLGGLRLPDLPLTPPRQPVQATSVQRIVVRSGDSLWRIAARQCADGASDAQVADLTERLYALNRATIGDDPDLIFPGMTLRAPEGRP